MAGDAPIPIETAHLLRRVKALRHELDTLTRELEAQTHSGPVSGDDVLTALAAQLQAGQIRLEPARDLPAGPEAIGWTEDGAVWLIPARAIAALPYPLTAHTVGRILVAAGLATPTTEPNGTRRTTARLRLGGRGPTRVWALTTAAAGALYS